MAANTHFLSCGIKLDILGKSLIHIFVWTPMYMIQKVDAEVTITQRYFQVEGQSILHGFLKIRLIISKNS